MSVEEMQQRLGGLGLVAQSPTLHQGTLDAGASTDQPNGRSNGQPNDGAPNDGSAPGGGAPNYEDLLNRFESLKK